MTAEISNQAERVALARIRAGRIRDGFASIAAWVAAVAAAYEERDWEALGYTSWGEYCDGEHGELRDQYSALGAEMLTWMRDAGMSLRAIGAATGRSHEQVRKQLSTVNSDPGKPQAGQHESPKPLTVGTNGNGHSRSGVGR